MTKDFRIFLKGKECTNKVVKYQKIGNKYNVVFNNGKQYTYAAYNVKVIESALDDEKSKNCFEYLKDIAGAVGLEKNGENILLSSYNKIKFIDKNSMLAKFIGQRLSSNNYELKQNIVYPFGFNNSQAQAVNKALSNELSIIEGPPGTGKTQTILNIIANIVMSGQSVAVVSSNNSATKNVLDKLKKYDVDFIAAFLGNLENKQEFIMSQSDLPNLSSWQIENEQIPELENNLKNDYQELQEKLEVQNRLALLKQELSNVELEQKHFFEYYKTLEVKKLPKCIR
ncbi:MAG: AAA domain-containing protein, partial [Candidatus Gastranaerophilaceae bacterium]